MKLLIDNNLSFRLVESLKEFSVASVHIKDALSIFADDFDIWEYAKQNELTILTKDNDFDELSQLFGCPPKVIHLMCGNKSTNFITELIFANKDEMLNFVEKDFENCLLKIG